MLPSLSKTAILAFLLNKSSTAFGDPDCIAIDKARREIIEKKYLEFLKDNPNTTIQESPEQTLIVIELLQRITLAISDLPDRPRLCLLLYYIEGLKQADIAKQLNLTTRTVQHDLAKAMVHCHQWIQKNT